MPATAGRVRMPANNRIHSSAALQTHGIWQSAIGYDPYAPPQGHGVTSDLAVTDNLSCAATYKQNPYDDYQALVAKARQNTQNVDEARGSCKKCGTVGHLTFQCRNLLGLKHHESAAVAVEHRIRGGGALEGVGHLPEGTSSEVETEISDSSHEDSEMVERALARRSSKRTKESRRHGPKKFKSSSKPKAEMLKDVSSTDSSDEERRYRKHRHLKEKSKSGRQHGSKRKTHTSKHSLSSDGEPDPSRIHEKKNVHKRHKIEKREERTVKI